MDPPPTSPNQAFPPTQWSQVAAAVGVELESSRSALNELCGNYWRPVYSFIRHLGHPPHDAEDLTQSYFADLVSRSYLRHADPNKGRFRTFLIRDLKFHLGGAPPRFLLRRHLGPGCVVRPTVGLRDRPPRQSGRRG